MRGFVVVGDFMKGLLVVDWGSGVIGGSRLMERRFVVSLLGHEHFIHLLRNFDISLFMGIFSLMNGLVVILSGN